MGFHIRHGEPLGGFTRYVPDEYSIVFMHDEERAEAADLGRGVLDSALEIGTLTLTVRTLDGRIAFLEGYHPKASWKVGEFSIPQAVPGVLFWTPTEELVRGGALRVADGGSMSSVFDRSTGCLRIRLDGEKTVPDSQLDTVGVCQGVTAGIDGTRLVALWVVFDSFFEN